MEEIYKNIEKWVGRHQEEWDDKKSTTGKFRRISNTTYSSLNMPLNEVDYKNLSNIEFSIFLENFYYSIFKR